MKRPLFVSFLFNDNQIDCIAIIPQGKGKAIVQDITYLPLNRRILYEEKIFNQTALISLMHTWLKQFNTYDIWVTFTLPSQAHTPFIEIVDTTSNNSNILMHPEQEYQSITRNYLGLINPTTQVYVTTAIAWSTIAQYELCAAQAGFKLIALTDPVSALCLSLPHKNQPSFIEHSENFTTINSIQEWLLSQITPLINTQYIFSKPFSLTTREQYILGASIGMYRHEL